MRNKAEARSQALSETGGQHGQGTHASFTPLHSSRSRGSRWWGLETGGRVKKVSPGVGADATASVV